MKQLVYIPTKCGTRMTIVCFVSGSGTNYREIATKNVNHDYIVFTNRPGCGGVAIASSEKLSGKGSLRTGTVCINRGQNQRRA